MHRRVIAAVFVATLASGAAAAASDEAASPPKKGWANETEFSVVITEGNSNTQNFGFKNSLERRWSRALLRLKLEALRSATSDDWFEQVDPGYTWEPGATPPEATATLVKPPSELDAENYFAEGRFDRKIGEALNWHAGASWDRNEDAGILSRAIVFGGLGNLWWSRDDLRFQTSYGLSWTDRQEETPDPEKDERFTGARLTATFLDTFGSSTTYTLDWTVNVNLADTGDWSSDMTNALSVTMSQRFALRVSLRWLYNGEPALEDVDVVARVRIVDPDGTPGSGDEYFETVADGGTEITFGETRVRKEKLDQVFKTTLVVSF